MISIIDAVSNFKTDEEIVFFGGSFNPWHQGHQACIDLLPKEKQLLVVLDRNPQKTQLKDSTVIPLIDLKSTAAIRSVYSGFLASSAPNPTIGWVKELKSKYPHLKASLLMGFDQLQNFKTWTKVLELSELLTKVYVVSRLENEEDFQRTKKDLESSLKLNVIHLGHHQFEDVSSTKLRSY